MNIENFRRRRWEQRLAAGEPADIAAVVVAGERRPVVVVGIAAVAGIVAALPVGVTAVLGVRRLVVAVGCLWGSTTPDP